MNWISLYHPSPSLSSPSSSFSPSLHFPHRKTSPNSRRNAFILRSFAPLLLSSNTRLEQNKKLLHLSLSLRSLLPSLCLFTVFFYSSLRNGHLSSFFILSSFLSINVHSSLITHFPLPYPMSSSSSSFSFPFSISNITALLPFPDLNFLWSSSISRCTKTILQLYYEYSSLNWMNVCPIKPPFIPSFSPSPSLSSSSLLPFFLTWEIWRIFLPNLFTFHLFLTFGFPLLCIHPFIRLLSFSLLFSYHLFIFNS